MNKQIKIKDRYIGKGNPCYIIAEMSANHGMDFENAVRTIRLAKEAGADAIKIQTYTPDTITINSDKEYFKIKGTAWEGENLYGLYAKAYTPWEWQPKLKQVADEIGIDFFSTPFDKTAVDFLEEMGIEFYKIASFELVDIPLIKYIATKGKPIIMSTGMGTLGEIEEAIKAVKSQGNRDVCLLKCTSAYPAMPEDMNLKTIRHFSETFGVPAGLSDHSLGSVVAVTAVALGANVVEKHFCISRDIKTPDSDFSMEPEEFKRMVEDIRVAEKSFGIVSYDVSEKEKASRKLRKSIFVSNDITQGDILTEENIRVVRPGHGLAPKYYEEVLGKRATKDIEKGTPLSWNMID